MTKRFDGKVGIVTGSAQGIGKAYAERLAREGAAVVVADIRAEGAALAAKEMSASGWTAAACPVDITDEGSVASMVAFATSEFGGVDLLINNAALYAGLYAVDPIEITVEDWDRVLTTNVRGTWQCIKAVVPVMRKRGGGRIVNQSSAGAWVASSVMHYSVAKGAVVTLTRLFAQALGGDGITVNAIAPGMINTDATMSRITDETIARNLALQAIDRIGTPEDLAGAVAFLCSDEAGFITGRTILIDGGLVKT